MGRPVIIDDGGSIRLRLMDAPGDMDGLLDNVPEHTVNDSYSTVCFLGVQQSGAVTHNAGRNFQKIELRSSTQPQHVVKAEIVGGGSKHLKITIDGQPGSLIMQGQHNKGKQQRNRPCYIDLSGGHVERIIIDDAAPNAIDIDSLISLSVVII